MARRWPMRSWYWAASFLALGLSLSAWGYAATWRTQQAEQALAAEIQRVIQSREFARAAFSVDEFRIASRHIVATHFRDIGGEPAAEQLLVRAVYKASTSLLAQQEGVLVGLPIKFMALEGSNNAHRLAEAILNGAGGLVTRSVPPDAAGKEGNTQAWAEYHGPALGLLALADTLDQAEPLPLVYALRGWFYLKHPNASEYQRNILLDVAAAESADPAQSVRGLCRLLRAGLARMRGNADEAASLISEARATGLTVDPAMERIVLGY